MTEPISLETAKNYLKVDTGDDNTLVTDLISAAREMAENFSGQVFLTKTIELVYDDAGAIIEIPYRPLQSVEKIEVISEAGVKSDVSSDLYNVDLPGSFLPGRICLKSGCTWPDHRGFASFIITIKAGYGDDGDSVPYSIKQAILQTIAHLYDNRAANELPEGARTLLQPYRIYRI
jgi:uncharacterized phiE125 gp8 family phage protein